MIKKEEGMEGINTTIMRRGVQLSQEQKDFLIILVTDKEIKAGIDGIGDNKTPRIDGYRARFLKPPGVLLANMCVQLSESSSYIGEFINLLTALS